MGKTSLDIREALIHDYHQKKRSGPAHSHNNFHIQCTDITGDFTVRGQSSRIHFRSSWQNSCTNLDGNTDFLSTI